MTEALKLSSAFLEDLKTFSEINWLLLVKKRPSLVHQQCVVYEFKCNSCDANYIGYASRHLHLPIDEHLQIP